jgi:hypothetical protein
MAVNPTPTAIQQNLPSPYIEGALTALSERLLPLLSTSAAINTASYAQQIAPQSALTQQAQGLAGGLGGYQPYLQQAGQLGTQAQQTLAGAQQYSGPQAYQQFMSPYQQDVINTTLQNYDVQAQKGIAPLSASAVGAGAFGGARQGIQQAGYQTQSDLNRAQLQAQLLNQGFGQAQQSAAQAYQQQLAAAQAQQGLGSFQQGLGQATQQLAGNQIQALNTLGGQESAYQQSILDAQKQAAKEAAFEPYTRYGLVGQQLTGLVGGFPTQVQTYQQQAQPASPFQQFLGTGIGLGSLAKGIFG